MFRLIIKTATHSMSWVFETQRELDAITEVLDELEAAYSLEFNYVTEEV